MTRILLSGYYGFSNAGDEAVLSSIITGLRAEIGEVEISVLSAACQETEKLHGVKALSRSPRNISSALEGCDLLISGGGSLIQDATSLKSLLYYLGVIRMARSRCKVMVLGQGIGPLRRDISRSMTRLVLDRVDAITVRDADSAALLREIGVRNPPIEVTADPTFILEPCPDAEAQGLMAEAGIGAWEEVIAVSMRAWPESPEIASITSAALRIVSEKLSAKVLLIAMQTPDDMQLLDKVHEDAKDTFLQCRPWTPRQIRGVLGKCRLVVGMRLHALILGSSAGVPCVGIAYDPKVESFMKAANQPCIPLNRLTPESLAAEVLEAWNNRESLSSRLKATIPPLKEAAMENFRVAKKLLGERG